MKLPPPNDRHPPHGTAGMFAILAAGLVVGCGQETEPSRESDPAPPPASESQTSESQISAAGIPRNALRYKRTLIREAHARFGLNAPIARLAGQIHQESGWRSDAKSPYAEELAQFTADTAEWIAKIYPKDLGAAAPYSPNWAIRALVIYDERILNGVKPYAAGKKVGECDRWAMAQPFQGGPNRGVFCLRVALR